MAILLVFSQNFGNALFYLLDKVLSVDIFSSTWAFTKPLICADVFSTGTTCLWLASSLCAFFLFFLELNLLINLDSYFSLERRAFCVSFPFIAI